MFTSYVVSIHDPSRRTTPSKLGLTRPPRLSSTARRTVAVQAAMDYKKLEEIATMAAKAGAEVVTAALDKPRNIQFKGTTDLVTEVRTR